jgi:glycosyltransferase involved in cell wall biosynthesis
MPNQVSVIIPTYNRAPLLSQAIESVLNQTVDTIEIIVVDDGSADPTEETIKQFGTRVRFFQRKHGGLNAARNFGLRQAQGTFIALLDDDDLWLPFKTELQAAVLNRFPDAAYVFSDFIIFNENGIKTAQGLSTWNNFPSSWKYGLEQRLSAKELGLPLPPEVQDCQVYLGRLYHELLFDPYVLPSTALVRRSAIKDDAPFPEENTHCGDWQFFAELSRNAFCIFLSLATTLNRSHGDAVRLTRKSPLIRTRDRLRLIEQVWRSDTVFLTEHNPDVCRVEEEQLLRIALLCILEGRRREAKGYLKRWRLLPNTVSGFKGLFISGFVHLWFGPRLLMTLRRLMVWRRS